jgi:hypothetical protein
VFGCACHTFVARGCLAYKPNRQLIHRKTCDHCRFATGSDDERSDVDVLVVLRDPGVGRLAELTERLSRRIGREVQLVRFSEAQTSAVLMVDVIDHGRVLVDRGDHWSSLGGAASRWRRLARSVERSSPAAIGEHDLDHHAA